MTKSRVSSTTRNNGFGSSFNATLGRNTSTIAQYVFSPSSFLFLSLHLFFLSFFHRRTIILCSPKCMFVATSISTFEIMCVYVCVHSFLFGHATSPWTLIKGEWTSRKILLYLCESNFLKWSEEISLGDGKGNTFSQNHFTFISFMWNAIITLDTIAVEKKFQKFIILPRIEPWLKIPQSGTHATWPFSNFLGNFDNIFFTNIRFAFRNF